MPLCPPQIPHDTGLGLNLCLRDVKLAPNYLSHDMTHTVDMHTELITL
jgi:hypothetical protein